MPRAPWRQHVLEALERREGHAWRLRSLLELHVKLQDRLETLLRGEGAGTEHQLEVIELRRERQELHQQLSFVTETLERTEAENREQRARMQRLAQGLGTLQHQYQGLQGRAWELSQEVEGLHGELDQVRGLLQKALQERQELEARWVGEKALEAERLNWALAQEERYQRKVTCLQEKLQRVKAGAIQTVARQASCSAPWEESAMVCQVVKCEGVSPRTGRGQTRPGILLGLADKGCGKAGRCLGTPGESCAHNFPEEG